MIDADCRHLLFSDEQEHDRHLRINRPHSGPCLNLGTSQNIGRDIDGTSKRPAVSLQRSCLDTLQLQKVRKQIGDSALTGRDVDDQEPTQMTAHTVKIMSIALEQNFFQNADQQVLIAVQNSPVASENEVTALTTGIVNWKVWDELQQMEITPKTLMAFSLFPAIHVAWANGRVEDAEKQAILKAAEKLGIAPASPAFVLLESWLSGEPDAKLFDVWKQFVMAIQQSLSEDAYQQLREAAIHRAKTIAEAAGGILGLHKVSRAESAAISELESAFMPTKHDA